MSFDPSVNYLSPNPRAPGVSETLAPPLPPLGNNRPGIIRKDAAAGIKPPTIGIPVNQSKKSPDDMDKALKKGEEAQGVAVAESFVKHCREQSNNLKRFLSDIHGLSQDGRRGFRVAVTGWLKEIRTQVAAHKGTAHEAVTASTARSAGVRLSEAVTFSKAVDAGYQPDFETETYHSMVAGARVYLDGVSSGPTQKRGRKPTPLLDKLKALLNKECKTPEDYKSAAQFTAALADLQAQK